MKLRMSHVLDDPYEFKKNPLYSKREFGDFTPFYVTITVCTVLGFALILLNVFFCWCSKHKYYWQDSNTGNRWISPVWTRTPYKQPPLDISEFELQGIEVHEVFEARVGQQQNEEYLELHKRESDL